MLATLLIGSACLSFIYYWYWINQSRIREFKKIAMANGDTYHGGREPKAFRDRILDSGHKLLQTGSIRRVRHLVEPVFLDGWMGIFEYEFDSAAHMDMNRFHAVMIESDKLPPIQFLIEHKWSVHKIKPKFGLKTKDIDFEMYPQFSERFFLSSDDETAVRNLFSDDVIRWFEGMERPYFFSLLPSNNLLLYARGGLEASKIETLKQDGLSLYKTLIGQNTAELGREHDW